MPLCVRRTFALIRKIKNRFKCVFVGKGDSQRKAKQDCRVLTAELKPSVYLLLCRVLAFCLFCVVCVVCGGNIQIGRSGEGRARCSTYRYCIPFGKLCYRDHNPDPSDQHLQRRVRRESV